MVVPNKVDGPTHLAGLMTVMMMKLFSSSKLNKDLRKEEFEKLKFQNQTWFSMKRQRDQLRLISVRMITT